MIPSRKVFGIGLSKTGTHSLASALERLGYAVKHFPLPGEVLALAGQLDALVDTPVILHMEELDRRYPDALFILTIREIESWIVSCRRHWDRVQPSEDGRQARKQVYGTADFDEAVFRRMYREHHARVKTLFEDRPGKLLTLNIVAGDGYEKLCPALGVPVISEPFPHKYAAPKNKPKPKPKPKVRKRRRR